MDEIILINQKPLQLPRNRATIDPNDWVDIGEYAILADEIIDLERDIRLLEAKNKLLELKVDEREPSYLEHVITALANRCHGLDFEAYYNDLDDPRDDCASAEEFEVWGRSNGALYVNTCYLQHKLRSMKRALPTNKETD